MNGEFFIGYLEECPPGIWRWVLRTALFLVLVTLGVAGAAALGQKAVEPGAFDFGHVQSFTGELLELPFPVLHIPAPTGDAAGTNYVLVGEGKHGVGDQFVGKHGHRVTLSGTVIQTGKSTMLEVAHDPAPKDEGLEPQDALKVRVLGSIQITGELVDTKCYFGVMRPGEGKVHRACAVRCLSGGVPPGLLVRDRAGRGFVIMLAGEENWEPLRFDPQWAARTISAEGQLEQAGNLLILRTRRLRLLNN